MSKIFKCVFALLLMAVGAVNIGAQTGWVNLINNSDMEGSDVSSFFSKTDRSDPYPSTITNGIGVNGSRGIMVQSTDRQSDSWDNQFWFRLNEPIPEGTKYRVTFAYRADENATIITQVHAEPTDYIYWDLFGELYFKSEWQTFTMEGEVTDEQSTDEKKFQSVAFDLNNDSHPDANKYYFDNIKFEIYNGESAGWFNLIRNDIYTSDKITFGNNEYTTFTGRDGTGGGDRPARIENDPTDGQPALVVRSIGASRIEGDQAYYIADNGEETVLNDWNSQFFISSRHVFHANERIKFSFEARADVPAEVNTEFHKGPGDFLSWGIFGSIQLQDQWKKYQFEQTITDSQDGGSTFAFDLNTFKDVANTYYFRNIELCIDEASATALDHVIGSEKVFLPVPLSSSEESIKIPVDFSECLEVIETNNLEGLLSGKTMRVQSGIGMASQESYSATSTNIIVNEQGNSTSNGVVSFHLEKEGTGNNVNFVISNPSGNYEGKTVNTHIYFEKDGWYYEYSITFVDRENYRLDTYRTIGYEDIFLPVPEPENTDGIRASIDLTNCLQTFETDEYLELISGEHMKVQESNGMLSKQAVSVTLTGASFNEDGFSDVNGTIKFHIDGNSEKKQTTFIINNTGGSFIDKNVKTRICFDNDGQYYVYNITFVDESTYRKLTSVKSFELNVTDEIGNPITEGITILWYNAKGENIGTGSSLYSIKEETDVYYSVILDENLGRKYREIIKQKVVSEQETVTCKLNRIEEISLHGKVSAYGTALYRAEVYLTQWLNGKYEYTASTLTDANGEFTLKAYNDSTELIILANGYIDNKIVRRHLNNGGELGAIEMNEVQGKVIALNLSYQEATKEGVEPIIQNWYSDTRNIGYNVQNLTKGTEITDYAIQQGNIVLPTGTDRGDRIQVTLNSLNEKFSEVTAEGIIADNDTANVDITLLAFGGIEAIYGQKADDNLLAMLYDSTGKLQMRTVCSSSRLTFTNLAAGTYSLVTMGYNGAIGSVADLSDLAGMDLSEGTDYVLSTATVRDGYITSVNVASVPELDASKFEYTGENTSFMPNKTQLVISNFITLTTRVDFKEQYAGSTDDVKIIVDIPEGCEFITNSVVIGNKPIPHSLNGNRLTISVDKEDFDQRIRFCLYPTKGGTFLTTAYAEFDYKGTKTQPIGQIRFEATTGELFVPSTTKTSSITVAGIGVPKADVEVYDNDALIGTTKSLGNGKWSLKCELNNAYNLSTHNIYVKYRGEGNVVGLTEAKECFYDINAIVPKTVTMVNTAHPASSLTPKVYETVFNYETVMAVQNYYLYWPEYPDFTFLIDLSENDTTKVSDVNLYVYTTDGDKRKLPAVYDGKLNRFVATSSFDMYSLPVNVNVEYRSTSNPLIDRKQMDDDLASIASQRLKVEQLSDSLKAITNDINHLTNSMVNESSELTAIIEQIESASHTNENNIDALIVDFLTKLGYDCTFEDLSPNVPLEITNEDIDKLLEETNSLVSNTDSENIVISINNYISDTDLLVYATSVLEELDNLTSGVSDTLLFEHDGIPMQYYEGDYSSINVEGLSDENVIPLSLTDGSSITVYTNDEKFLFVDHGTHRVWIIEAKNEVVNTLKLSRRAIINIPENLRFSVEVIKNTIQNIFNWVDEQAQPIRNDIKALEEGINNNSNWKSVTEARLSNLSKELKQTEAQLKYFDKWVESPAESYRHAELLERKLALETKRASMLNELKTLNKEGRIIEKRLSELKRTRILKVALLGQVMDLWNIGMGLYKVVNYANNGIQDYNRWTSFINSISSDYNCPSEEESNYLKLQAELLINNSINDRDRIGRGYISACTITGLSTAISGYLAFNKGIGWILKSVGGGITDFVNDYATSIYNQTSADSRNAYQNRLSKKKLLKCKKDKKNDDDDNNDDDPETEEEEPKHDPSGFVYEAVPTNRISGVKATVYYNDDDMPVQWNGEEYGEINPQITDESGLYAWDVPQGTWKVIFEKEGYETTQTDWLPVPPPQLEINIPMSQAVAPYVEDAKGMESGITLSFSKYMKPNTLTKSSRVSVTRNGKSVGGVVELLNLEENPFNHEEYASKIKFVPNTAFTTSDEVIITVKKEVESYANKQMTEDFVQRVKIESEITEIACDSMIAVDYQGTGVLEISVLPAAAAKGRTIQVASSSSMIAAIDVQSVTLNDEGKARIVVSGELPGNASLHLSMPEAGKEKYIVVNVVTKESEVVKAPKASKLSGSTIENGYLLTLTCATKGATIYYTLDGSCPCDSTMRKKYTGPFALPAGQVTVSAIAVRQGMEDSDVATFTYTVEDNGQGIAVAKADIHLDAEYADGVLTITGAEGCTVRVFDLLGHELASRKKMGHNTSITVPKAESYIISVTTRDGQTVVRKVTGR